MSNNDIDPKLQEEMDNLDQEDVVSEDEESEGTVSEMETEEEEEQQDVVPEVVQKAKKNGYLTREEYIQKNGSDKGFKSPEEFNKFGEIYPELKEALKGINKKLEQRDKELEASLKYIDRVRERERDAARRELAEAIRQAGEIGDVEAVRNLTKEESKLDYQDAQEAAKQATEQVQSIARSFEERNPWYNKDPEMTARAVQIDQEIRNGLYEHIMPRPANYEQLGSQIEIIMRQEYGDRIQAQSQRRAEPVLSRSNSAVAKAGSASAESKVFKTLDEDLKSIYRSTKRMLEKNGIEYSETDFVNKLKKDGEI